MAMVAPSWIDTRYVKDILQKMKYNEFDRIIDITVKPATVKGDNYLSDMYRVCIEFTWVRNGVEILEKKSVLAKVLPEGHTGDKQIPITDFFETEMDMVMNILPKMNRILNEIGMKSLSAECLIACQENPMHLVIEDLAPRGFRMAARQNLLNLDHCLLAMRNIGRFHASSIALREEDLQAVLKYSKGILFMDRSPVFRRLARQNVKVLAKEARKWDELNPRIPEKLLKLAEVTFDRICEATNYKKDDFNVLNHGDFWINNMMFAYDASGKPNDHLFVDFQICQYGSPALDILKFLGSSPTDNVRQNDRESLLREYHNSLTSTMSELQCTTKIPSFDDLEDMLKSRAFIEVFTSFLVLPILLPDQSEAKTIDDYTSANDDEYDNSAYRHTEYKKIMTRLLPLYDSMGLLDV